MIVPLTGPACVRTAETLRALLLDAFANADSVEIDASAITEIDLSVVQLIEAARVHAAREGKAIRLTAPADAAMTALLLRAGILTQPTADDLHFWRHGELPQ